MEPLTWNTLEYEEKNRHADWIWYVGLIFAIGATISFFYDNLFFGIFLIIAGISIIIFALRQPQMISVQIEEKAIVINNNIVTYDRVRQFWIDETEKPDKLLLLVKGSFVPMLVVPLAGVSAQTVREAMLPHAPEIYLRESVGTKIADRLGF